MASANEYFGCARAVGASTMIVEVEKIVYRDREPPEDEGPIKLAKETKKVQRSAAPRAQRSAAPPPQKKEAVTSSQVNHVHSQACVCIYICHTIVRGRLCIFSKSTYMHTCTTTYAGATGTGAVGVMDQQQLAGCYIHNRTGDHGRSQVHTHIPSTNLYNKQSHSCTLSHVSACASRMSW